jgi:hypothetical protein
MAVLLPVRGAVAAAMLCAPVGAAHHQEVRVHDLLGTQQLATDSATHHPDLADHTPHGHDDHGSSSGTSDKCNLCSACCSVVPMVSRPPTVAVPPGVTDVLFPSVSAPAPSFVSAGQERPPRTI